MSSLWGWLSSSAAAPEPQGEPSLDLEPELAVGDVAFPLLPKFSNHDFPEPSGPQLPYGPDSSLSETQGLHAPNLTAILNDPQGGFLEEFLDSWLPLAPLSEEDLPGFSDDALGMPALWAYVRQMRPKIEAWHRDQRERRRQIRESAVRPNPEAVLRLVPEHFRDPAFSLHKEPWFATTELLGLASEKNELDAVASLGSPLSEAYFSSQQHRRWFLWRLEANLHAQRLGSIADTVEAQSFRLLARRSRVLVDAADTIRRVHLKAGVAVDKASELRSALAQVRSRCVHSSLQILRTQRRMHNVQKLMERLELIEAVRGVPEAAKELLAKDDILGSLHLTSRALSLFEVPDGRLAGIKCLNAVLFKLQNIRTLSARLGLQQILNLGFAPLEKEASVSAPLLPGLSVTLPTWSKFINLQDERTLVSLTSGVLSAGFFLDLLAQLGDHVKELTRQCIEEQVDDFMSAVPGFTPRAADSNPSLPAQASPASAAPSPPGAEAARGSLNSSSRAGASVDTETRKRLVAALSPAQFSLLLARVFAKLGSLLHRSNALLVLLERHFSRPRASSAQASASSPGSQRGPPTPPLLPVESKQSAPDADLETFDESETRTMFQQICRYAHIKCAALLSWRGPIHAELPLELMKAHLDQCLSFVIDGEMLCGQPLYELKKALLAQAKRFLADFHQLHQTIVRKAFLADPWVAVEIPIRYQQLLDNSFVVSKVNPETSRLLEDEELSESPISVSPLRDTVFRYVGKPLPTVLDKDMLSAEEVPIGSSSAEPSDPAEDEIMMRFPTLSCFLVLLDSIVDYIQCANQLRAVSNDVLKNLTQLIQFFSAQLHRMILGAEAMKQCGLKSITATNLALSSQVLGLLVLQLPQVAAALEKCIPYKQHPLLQSLVGLRGELLTHRRRLHLKLVSVAQSLIDATLAQYVQSLGQGPKLQPALKEMIRQITHLHSVLGTNLHSADRGAIFELVCQEFSRLWTKHLSVPQAEGPHKAAIEANLSYCVKMLRRLDGVDAASCSVLEGNAKPGSP